MPQAEAVWPDGKLVPPCPKGRSQLVKREKSPAASMSSKRVRAQTSFSRPMTASSTIKYTVPQKQAKRRRPSRAAETHA